MRLAVKMKVVLSSQAASAFLSRVALYEGTWQKFRNGGQNNDRSSALLDIAATSAHDVIESGFFELFAPEELGTEAYKYLFILEMINRILLVLLKVGIRNTFLLDVMILHWLLLVLISHKDDWVMLYT